MDGGGADTFSAVMCTGDASECHFTLGKAYQSSLNNVGLRCRTHDYVRLRIIAIATERESLLAARLKLRVAAAVPCSANCLRRCSSSSVTSPTTQILEMSEFERLIASAKP